MRDLSKFEKGQIVAARKAGEYFHHMVMDDRQLTINAISISRERVENIPHKELGMTKISAWWVPRLLTFDQKRTRLIASQEIV